jgi:hypothetical protein
LRRRIRVLTLVVIVGLVVSGATALPLEWELTLAARALAAEAGAAPATNSSLTRWIVRVRDGLKETYAKHPFVAYGTDWLAFGHFVIAIAFIGAWRDPVRNAWLFTFGLVACSLVVPYALVLGALRGLPIYWRLIDGSFGVAGFVPLWCCRRYVQELERGCGGAQARPGGSNRAGRNPTAG